MKILLKLLACSFFILGIINCSSCQKVKPSKNMTQISPLENNITLKVGQKAYYSASVHGSVGVQSELYIDNESVLKLVETTFEYKNPSKKNMSGGDGGTRYYIMEATQVGETYITAKELFRGDEKNTYKIKVTVKE